MATRTIRTPKKAAPKPRKPSSTKGVFKRRSPARDGKFFGTLEETADVSASARSAGYPRRSVYEWRDKDPAFKAKWDSAWELGVDAMEEEARRRGMVGDDQPVYQGGKLVGKTRKYSDTLLMFMLKGRRPDRFRDNSSLEVAAPGGGPVAFNVTLVAAPGRKPRDE
jgi:hypothetical protein